MTLHKQNASPWGDILFLAAGELLVSLVTVAVFCLVGRYDWRVLTGALAGSAVMVANFAILSVSVARAVDRVMAGREASLSEEEAEAFAAAHAAEIQKSVKGSYLIRQLLMIAVIATLLFLKLGNVIATLIPLLAFRPILTVREALRAKKAKT